MLNNCIPSTMQSLASECWPTAFQQQALAIALQLERELTAAQKSRSGAHVDAIWPPLRSLLHKVLAGGSGNGVGIRNSSGDDHNASSASFDIIDTGDGGTCSLRRLAGRRACRRSAANSMQDAVDMDRAHPGGRPCGGLCGSGRRAGSCADAGEPGNWCLKRNLCVAYTECLHRPVSVGVGACSVALLGMATD